jgi:hypothetical protein
MQVEKDGQEPRPCRGGCPTHCFTIRETIIPLRRNIRSNNGYLTVTRVETEDACAEIEEVANK